MNYKNKYLKYKTKYCQLKKKKHIQSGGNLVELQEYITALLLLLRRPDEDERNFREISIYEDAIAIADIPHFDAIAERISAVAEGYNRLFHQGSHMKEGYSVDEFKQTCYGQNDQSVCNSLKCCTFDDTCNYDIHKCMGVSEVRTYADYKNHVLDFYKKRIPGSGLYPGPWNFETSLILDQLIGIVRDTPFIPYETQPGLYCVKYRRIQLPFITMSGTPENVLKLLKILHLGDRYSGGTCNYIAYIFYRVDSQGDYKRKFPNFADPSPHVSVTLGVYKDPELGNTFLDYIFSNKFFDDILAACRLVT